jgi:hypothetical protein
VRPFRAVLAGTPHVVLRLLSASSLFVSVQCVLKAFFFHVHNYRDEARDTPEVTVAQAPGDPEDISSSFRPQVSGPRVRLHTIGLITLFES